MKDPRLEQLASVIIQHSTELKAGDKVLIEAFDAPQEMVVQLVQAAAAAGAIPLVSVRQNVILRELYRNATVEQMQLIGEVESYRMERMDAYIGLRGSWNTAELGDVPGEKMKLYQTHWWQPVHVQRRVRATRWVVLRWPTPLHGSIG